MRSRREQIETPNPAHALVGALARRWNVPPVDIARSIGIADETLLARAYAAWRERPFLHIGDPVPDIGRDAALVGARHRAVTVANRNGGVLALMPAPERPTDEAIGCETIVYTTPSAFQKLLNPYWPDIVRHETARLATERPHFSAAYRRTGPQLVWFAICAFTTALGVVPMFPWPSVAANLLLCIAFLSLAILRVAAWQSPTYRPTPLLPERDLPTYTVLVPVHREAAVLADLVGHLSDLDYPPPKLDIRLLVEADDEETRAALAQISLPPTFSIVDIAVAEPRTKPKALNVGMLGAWGELVTIYDAEDVPDRDQLRKAASYLKAAGHDVGCVQARLRVDNGAAGPLAALFALEYEALFRRFLPALSRLGLPLPLGGTSNHIRGLM